MIRRGGRARFVGEDLYFTTGMIVFVREVRDDEAVIQDPYDSHMRCLVPLADLEEA